VAIAATNAGTARAWGANDSGQLGIGGDVANSCTVGSCALIPYEALIPATVNSETGAPNIWVDGVPATGVTVISDTELTFIAPAMAAGKYVVYLAFGAAYNETDFQAEFDGLTYVAAPEPIIPTVPNDAIF
jgi:hypothetical protein